MNFNHPGYTLKFIQKDKEFNDSVHEFTYIYKFFSPITKYHYILRAEYHKQNVFAVKFYKKLDRGSDNKYSKIINKGDLGNILITCASVVPLLLSIDKYRNASFCLAGARTIDKRGLIEDQSETQRFKVYSYILSKIIGESTFAHFQYPNNSSYLLLNRSSIIGNIIERENEIKEVFISTYNTHTE